MAHYYHAPPTQSQDGQLERWPAYEDEPYSPEQDDAEDTLAPEDSLSQIGMQGGSYHPQMHPMGYYNPLTYQPSPAYPYAQGYYIQPSQPIYQPAAAQSPTPVTYVHYRRSSRKSSRHYGHHHPSGSRSHHASPSSTSSPLPGWGLGTHYIPTVSLSAEPMDRSYSSPPHSAQYTAYSGGYATRQQAYPPSQPAGASYQYMNPAYGTEIPQYPQTAPVSAAYQYTNPNNGTLTPYALNAYGSPASASSTRSHSRSRRSSHSGSHYRSRSISRSATPSEMTYVHATTGDRVVIPFGNGGQIILPPNGTTYVSQMEDHSNRGGKSFLASLKNFALGSRTGGRRLKRTSSRSSY